MHIAILLLFPISASADPAEIIDSGAVRQGDNWQISVTLRHRDLGWNDFADGWRVEAQDGTVVAVRDLLHPHVDEQPFTRSVSGVAFPEGAESYHVRARTTKTGWGAQRSEFSLP